ncbi:MAG: hypothetical protein M1820_000227 [Bogoriella megaspora]|nr:MAG: hypothetical protein M1820_000227 [Bogoriella megaspora]
MSSRALRRAQKEKEEQARLNALQDVEDDDDEPQPQPSKGMFSMLEQDDGYDDAESEEEAVDGNSEGHELPTNDAARVFNQTHLTPMKRKKKKKKSKKAKDPSIEDPNQDSGLDEIDAALQALSTKAEIGTTSNSNTSAKDAEIVELCKLLSVDVNSLHASNEMRRLFGRTALEHENEDGEGRRNRGQQRGGLAAAVGARGSTLADLARRRNVFMQGKENWPSAPSGGLGMQVIERNSDGTVEYAFVHNGAYKDSQQQFEAIVASMDPERMIQHLHFNPYHIATLLQVSEIAKHQQDHAIAGELLERALFSFGRAVHSTFSSNISSGKARMSFSRPENREFWLTVWRFIANLSMRSLFRTAYEWLKLLLGLDPFNDPYRVCLVIDQYAVRAKQQQHFNDLYWIMDKPWLWGALPNIQITRALAANQLKIDNCKQVLYEALGRWKWITTRLFQELEIDQIPPGVWGVLPRTDRETFEMELYVKRAKAIWNTPEDKELLIEIASAIPAGNIHWELDDMPMTIDEARHILLTEDSELIKHIPKDIVSKVDSAHDPLPPEDEILEES